MTTGTPRIEGYEDLEVIGRGGFSTVYAATQVDLGRRVAVKVLNFDVSEEAAQRRFERECKVVGMLTGAPGVVGVHTPAFTEDGRPCIVMQLMEGGTLQSHVLDNGPVDADVACELAQRLAEALAAAHGKDVAHRDIKPGNVLLTADGEPALADFGIAVVEHLACSSQTVESLSPPFAAPERLLGGEIDEKRADIYSLGATICFALTGVAPFGTAQRGGVSGLVKRVLEDPPPSLGTLGLPGDLSDLVTAMLSKQPEDRPPSASSVVERCERIAAESKRITSVPTASVAFSAPPKGDSTQASFGYSLDPADSAANAAVTGLGVGPPPGIAPDSGGVPPESGPQPPPYNPPSDPHSGLLGESDPDTDMDAGVWPTAVDYAQAIQDRSSLLDPDLAGVAVQEDLLGMPVSAAGQSAVVFHVMDGTSAAAVRFFTRPPRDGRIRYTALGEHLQGRPCEPVVSTRWVEGAIRVGDHDRPAVWMPWAQGRPLNLLVEDLLVDPLRLHSLAELWLGVLDRLRASGIAHGDLQNGNILVTDELAISLVDLDGVWVPSLRGRPPAETGHLCFQHRVRSTRHWGPEMDSFSGFLIYTSLLALSAEPDLWRFHQGENLVLGAEDLRSAPDTEAWKALLKSRSAEVRALSELLADLASADEPPACDVRELVESVGPADEVTIRRPGPNPAQDDESAVPAAVKRGPVAPSAAPSGSDWWVQPQRIDVPDPGGASVATSASTDANDASNEGGDGHEVLGAPSNLARPVQLPDPDGDNSVGSPPPAADPPWRRTAIQRPLLLWPLVGLCCGLAASLAELVISTLGDRAGSGAGASMQVILVVGLGLLGACICTWPLGEARTGRRAVFAAVLGLTTGVALSFSATLLLDVIVATGADSSSVAPFGYVAMFTSIVFGLVAGAAGFTRSSHAGLVLCAAGLVGGFLAAVPIALSGVHLSGGSTVELGPNTAVAAVVAAAMALAGLAIGAAFKRLGRVSQ